MNKSIYYSLIITFLISLGSITHAADLKFSRCFSNKMVLQRDKPVMIRGFADRDANITVTFAGQPRKI